jgi:hypothetical protein
MVKLYLYIPENTRELSLVARKRAARQTLIKNLERFGKEKGKYSQKKEN